MADSQKPTLAPLPVDVTGTVQSFASATNLQPTNAPAAEPKVEEPDYRDIVDRWVDENPTFNESDAQPKSDDAPIGDAPTVEPTIESTEPTTTPATATTTATAPVVAEPKAQEEPQPTTQATIAPKPLAADERIRLTDSDEWTREQIVSALQERAHLQPVAAEADAFRQLFQSNAVEAKQNWGPLLERLAREPQTVTFLDQYLSNTDKAAYLEACAQEFDRQTIGAAPVPVAQQPRNDPQTVALHEEIRKLSAWREQQERQTASDRINRELSAAVTRYPFLATDVNLRRELLLTAQMLNAQDTSKGITDAIALKAPLYDALSIARGAQQTPQQPSAPVVPVLLGSPGASPTATRQPPSNRPKKFASIDDAVDDWVSNTPTQFK